MAKSSETINKKGKEKKRLRHKQDKKQRMEERKANKRDGNSLEGMLAYIDENGDLSDTPPDPSGKKVFQREDMQTGLPKKEYQDRTTYHTGKIIFYNKSKGFGFVNDDSTNERIFFHVRELQDDVEEMDPVRYLIEPVPRGLTALQLTRLT